MGSPIAELERYLEMESENISVIELERTQRQMQFFVDTVSSLDSKNNQIFIRMQNAIEIINDFIDMLDE